MRFDPFRRETGIMAPLPAENIDTDVIMPKAFLKGIDRSGLEEGLFHDLRFDGDGSPRPDFILNRAPWSEARFLVTGANFGCGSSREHAVWGLAQFGIRAIIAPSFSGIFFDNCARNGLLAVEANEEGVSILLDEAGAGKPVTIDLEAQTIEAENECIRFDIEPRRKQMIMEGLDAIDMTLAWRKEIDAFQSDYLQQHPWLA